MCMNVLLSLMMTRTLAAGVKLAVAAGLRLRSGSVSLLPGMYMSLAANKSVAVFGE